MWQAEFSLDLGLLYTFIPENEKSFVWTSRYIIEFPGTKKEGFEFLQNPKTYQLNNLPSFITSIAKDNDKFWVAYGHMI